MKFCSDCGAVVELRIPQGDNLPRYVCTRCEAIHYQNPKIVTGCIPQWENKILLCKRAIQPRYGFWTLPAGFMENNETTAQAARRETLEEAHSRVESLDLYALFNIPHINQVYIMYRAKMVDLEFKAGEESLDVALFTQSEIPWEVLAFPVIHETVKLYFADYNRGEFSTHVRDICPGN